VLHRLDGLPLGIELAARQVAVMPMHAVRDRLNRALDLATGREGREDERQRTLRATIDSSYRLLDDAERRLLCAIAPFPGGVDLATVEALASSEASGDPLDLLHRLVDSSLVVADATGGRYRRPRHRRTTRSRSHRPGRTRRTVRSAASGVERPRRRRSLPRRVRDRPRNLAPGGPRFHRRRERIRWLRRPRLGVQAVTWSRLARCWTAHDRW